jgi:hypothetical protein
VHADACLFGAMAQGRMFGGQQFCGMPALVQTVQKQQSLVLPAAPIGFEIDNEGDQAAPRFLACFSASTSFPSF